MAGTSELRASGSAALALATRLLQRARIADPIASIWEAADLQWWWRMPRRSDERPQLFWADGDGPVGCVYLTEWGGTWQCDLLRVPGAAPPSAAMWERAREEIASLAPEPVEVPTRDGDTAFAELLQQDGFVPGDQSGTCWMEAGERAPFTPLPPGFTIVDRTGASTPHPMRQRNGEEVESRLREGSLYDPALDLAVVTAEGEVAGYSLYWFDPVTRVGLLEPMRVEDDFQRRGLARAMIAEGLERLAQRGATRVKVGYESEAAGALYQGSGFRPATNETWFRSGTRAAAR